MTTLIPRWIQLLAALEEERGALVRALQRRDVSVRYDAVKAMRNIIRSCDAGEVERIVASVQAAAEDSCEEVRTTAQAILADLSRGP